MARRGGRGADTGGATAAAVAAEAVEEEEAPTVRGAFEPQPGEDRPCVGWLGVATPARSGSRGERGE